MTANTSVREPLRFWKMSGAGNDFIALPFAPEDLDEDPSVFVRRVCARGLSVGADGVLFVTPGTGGERSPDARVASSRGSGTAASSGFVVGASAAAAASPAAGGLAPRGAVGVSPSKPSAPADAVLVHYNADGGR